MKGKKKERTLTVNTVKTFAQTLRMMALSKELIETDDIATKREAYYVSKNWDAARFREQAESDAVMDDVEAFFELNREQLGFIPEEKGGDVAGKLVVIDRDRDTGRKLRIDCTKFGSGAYSIPISVEELEFETKADFILVIETAGMFQRLVKHNYWKQANCILISMGGVPTRACRRFIRRLADEKKIPVYVFVDGDPYGISNIYRTLKVGSGNAAHLNEFFCVPQARFLGITPQDIVTYELPTHPLKEVDIKRAKDALKNDPFILHHKAWQNALSQLVKMGVRAEQQALAKHGLNYVIDTYLPEKLGRPERFLP
jgi:DNA topoisomerase-6 subunit A